MRQQATGDQYRLLLDRTRSVFNGCGALKDDGGKLSEAEQGRIDVRRAMHLGAASKDPEDPDQDFSTSDEDVLDDTDEMDVD